MEPDYYLIALTSLLRKMTIYGWKLVFQTIPLTTSEFHLIWSVNTLYYLFIIGFNMILSIIIKLY